LTSKLPGRPPKEYGAMSLVQPGSVYAKRSSLDLYSAVLDQVLGIILAHNRNSKCFSDPPSNRQSKNQESALNRCSAVRLQNPSLLLSLG